MSDPLPSYQIIASSKQHERQSRIPPEWLLSQQYDHLTNVMHVPETCSILTNEEINITSNFDATAMLENLKSGIFSAEEVVTAFCKRAAIAHQLTNCLTEILFSEAIARARELDRERQSQPNGKLRPLHGLPISLKDSFDVAGYDTSTGLACFAHAPATQHSALAALLLDLGAVLYCKTNLPQTIMTGDSDNNVFGRTLNPRNTALTAGGSTGGEGALIALRGSVLGVGTDIGGSIRVPSLCNGIYGFRPSAGIVPHSGVRNLTTPGMDVVRSSAGPMATSIRDIELFMETIMRAQTWKYDNAAIPIAWKEAERKAKLRIGLVQDNGVHTPTPPVRRGLAKAADLLRASENVEIVPTTLPNVGEIYGDLLRYFTLDGAKNYLKLFSLTDEPEIPSLRAIGLSSLPPADISELFKLNERREAAINLYHELFRAHELDAILMTPAPHTALSLDMWTSASYTGLWNYLDYPAMVIPVDTVRETDFADEVSNAKYGAGDDQLYGLYTGPEDYKCAPIAVQLVGYRYKDQELLRTAALVDAIVHGRA